MQDRASLIKSFYQVGREDQGRDFNPQTSINDFAKTFMSGGDVNPTLAGAGDYGSALRLENLDNTMTSVLIDESEFKLFPFIEREVVTQQMFMYNKRLGYGSNGGRGKAGFTEGDTPVGGQATYERDTAHIRYFGTRRGVSHQFMQMSEAGGTQLDVVEEENRNGTMAIMEQVERAILWGDASILDGGGNVVHYDGIVKQMLASPFASQNVLDLRAPINPDVFNFIGTQLRQEGKLHNFSKMKTFMPPAQLQGLSQELMSTGRVVYNQTANPQGNGAYLQAGGMIAGMQTNFGWLGFEDSILMERIDSSLPVNAGAASGNPSAPTAPATPTATAGAVGGGRVSSFKKGQTSYYYAAAFNNYGESLATYAGGGTAITAGQEVGLAITNVTGAWGYRIYRNDVSNDVTTAGIIGEIAANGGTVTFYDDNDWLPNTDVIVMLERDKRDLAIAQLMPLIKFPLAVVSTKQEFLLMLYHTVLLKAPQRAFIIKNVVRQTY
jgi:hypothetical protein